MSPKNEEKKNLVHKGLTLIISNKSLTEDGSIQLDGLSMFNIFMHFSNVLFPQESENNNSFFSRIFLKLFRYEAIYYLFNTEETQILTFPIFYMLIYIEYFMLVFIIRTQIPESQAKQKFTKI